MDKLLNSLLSRVVLVILTILVLTGLVPLAFLANPSVHPDLLRWIVVILLGLIAGATARLILPGRAGWMRWLTAGLGLVGSLILLGSGTQGYVGFHQAQNASPPVSLDGLGQFIVSSLLAGLVLKPGSHFIQTRSHQTGPEPTKKRPAVNNPEVLPPSRTHEISPARKGRNSRKTPPANLPISPQKQPWAAWGSRLSKVIHRWWEYGLGAPSALRSRLADRPAVRLSEKDLNARPAGRRASRVRLIGVEEHRCPYCLEEVQKKDPRGVKVCPICHTYHHADCWAVTGNCQVPHHHG